MDIQIDRTCKTPAYRQLYEQIRRAIESGELSPMDKLPKIRDLAASLGIARNTVEAAYKQLAFEGYAMGHRGVGYIVEELDFSVLDESRPDIDERELIAISEATRNKSPLGDSFGCEYDFCYGDRGPGMLPTSTLKALADQAITGSGNDAATQYIDPFGLPSLREQIAKHLHRTRGVRCMPEQIILKPGTQVALNKIAGIFDAEERIVAMEDPGYNTARYAFERAGCTVRPAPTYAGDRAFLSAIEQSGARLVMVTPSNQFPLGHIMPLSTRLKLMEWAQANDAYVIEDDYCCEYRYGSSPTPTLRSIDRHHTIYLGTMSKILTPAVRISYIVLPAELLARWNAAYPDEYCTLAWINQEMLQRFMASDAWGRYMRTTINMYKKHHALLVKSLHREMGDRVRIFGEDAGLHLLVEDSLGRSQDELIELARKEGVRVYPTDQYWMDKSHPLNNLVLIGFSGIVYDKIPEGIRRLARAWYRGK